MTFKLKDIPLFNSGKLLQLLLTPNNYTDGQREALRDAFAQHLNEASKAVGEPFSVAVKRTYALLEISYKVDAMPPDFNLVVWSSRSTINPQFTPASIEWNYTYGTQDNLRGVENFAKALLDATNLANVINQLRNVSQSS